ncbi:MAG: hypothetical protein RI950_524 [Bacteroidota bacterium]|jgi:hypothetical protein
MKNQSFAYLLLVGFGILTSCVNVTTSSYVTDDLYDEANRSVQVAKVQAAKAAKDKKYLDFQDLDESDVEVIEEEDGLAQQSYTRVNPNLYQSAYQQGLSDGLFNSPYLGYGYRYTPFSYWSPSYTYFMNPYSTIGLGMGYAYFNPYSFYSPFNSPFYSPFGNNSFYNNYNYYGPGGNYTGYSGQYQTNDIREKKNFGPRDDRSNNRNSGGNYTNSPRGGNNSYNTQGNNLPRVVTQQNASSGSSAQPYVAPRRNSNYEYRAAPSDGGGVQRGNSTSTSTSTPSYSSPSSGGGSSSGGGGGGSSRGPR